MASQERILQPTGDDQSHWNLVNVGDIDRICNGFAVEGSDKESLVVQFGGLFRSALRELEGNFSRGDIDEDELCRQADVLLNQFREQAQRVAAAIAGACQSLSQEDARRCNEALKMLYTDQPDNLHAPYGQQDRRSISTKFRDGVTARKERAQERKMLEEILKQRSVVIPEGGMILLPGDFEVQVLSPQSTPSGGVRTKAEFVIANMSTADVRRDGLKNAPVQNVYGVRRLPERESLYPSPIEFQQGRPTAVVRYCYAANRDGSDPRLIATLRFTDFDPDTRKSRKIALIEE